MQIQEVRPEDLLVEQFITEQIEAIRQAVGEGLAVNALSGGVDSAVVTLLGHRALGERLKTYFIENGLMRAGEPQRIVEIFAALGVTVEIVDAGGPQAQFRRRVKKDSRLFTTPASRRSGVHVGTS